MVIVLHIEIMIAVKPRRSLATGHIRICRIDVLKAAAKETKAAFVVSLSAGLLLFLVAGLWSNSYIFGLVTGLSILAAATVGGLIGCLAPIAFKRLGIDPA